MFTLPFELAPSDHKIELKHRIFSIGSCFSDNIGQRLSQNKFDVLSNPFGIIYNPYSIFKIIRLLLSEGLDPNHYIQNQGVYFHWDTHSTISGTNLDEFQELLADRSLRAKTNLINAEWIVLTLGSAFAYKKNGIDEIVGNCHKVSQNEFEKITMSTQEIIEDYEATVELVHTINPKARFILTVSPVRHIRDGLMANNHSKAILIQAIQHIIRKSDHTHYFPAYEIMIDELRDYRFYKTDRIHPTEEAIEYIWNKFIKVFMSADANQFINDWQQVRKSIQHRGLHPKSAIHQKFLRDTLKKLKEFENRVDISDELTIIYHQLTK